MLCSLLLLSAPLIADDGLEVFEENFIEFLGSWETADGEWIAPEEIASMPMPEAQEQETQNGVDANEDE